MGKMSQKFEKLLEKGKLEQIEVDPALSKAELAIAPYDLGRAKESLKDADYKWATIQAYYSMFHVVRALLFLKGYREKSHWALLVALKEFYGDELRREDIQNFQDAMDMREAADYGGAFSEDGAKECIENAEAFLEIGNRLVAH